MPTESQDSARHIDPQRGLAGAKFGAKVAAIIFGSLLAIFWLSLLGLVVYRWLSTGASPLVQRAGLLELLKTFAISVFAVAMASFYAALFGAIIMGIAAFFQKFRRTDSEK